MATPTRHRTTEHVEDWIGRAQNRIEERTTRSRNRRRDKRDAAFTKARDVVQNVKPRQVIGVLAIIGAALLLVAMATVFTGSHDPERLGDPEPASEALASINARESYQGLSANPVTADGGTLASGGSSSTPQSGQTGSSQSSGGSNTPGTSSQSDDPLSFNFDGSDSQLPEQGEIRTFDDTALLALGVTPRPDKAVATAGLVISERADLKLATTDLNDGLSASATNHAMYLAARGELCHTTVCNTGAAPSGPFTAWGENVGYRGDGNMQLLHRAFKKSPPHYANMIDPRWNEIGVGAAEGKLKDGREAIFVVVQFAHA